MDFYHDEFRKIKEETREMAREVQLILLKLERTQKTSRLCLLLLIYQEETSHEDFLELTRNCFII